MASVLGLHHVRLPVVDVEACSDWYRLVFEFEILLYEEEELGPVGAVLRHPSGAIVGLHRVDAATVARLKGFSLLGLTADDLRIWIRRLDELRVAHSDVTKGHTGYFVDVPDPNGMIVQLHTAEQPDVEEG